MVKSYYITGPDGSGKTTYIKEIENYFSKQNIPTQHIWLRSPKITSKPLMAFCRLIGLTKYHTINGIRYGGHEFYRSRVISWLFPILQLVDFKLKWFFLQKKINSKNILLFDRFALDTLADLMCDTHRFKLHKTWLGKQFIKSIPQNTKTIILKVNTETIRSRKLDTKHDPNLDTKVKVYNILSEDLNIEWIDNEQSKEKVLEQLLNKIK